MIKHEYALAFLAAIEEGVPVDKAIAGLKEVLADAHHEKMLESVLIEDKQAIEKADKEAIATISVAAQEDFAALKSEIDMALEKLGVTGEVQRKELVDPTLIGGFVASYNFKEFDASHKKSLKLLYESIIK
jgi:F0F1-type ATP synthase delta subunit